MSIRYKPYDPRPFRRVMTLLAMAGLSACALIIQNFTPVPYTPSQPFEYACQELEKMYDVACGDLEAPTIIYSRVVYEGFYGVYYPGEPYIFINSGSPPEMWEEIVLHEMGHYVIYELELPGRYDTCEGERVVREISGGEWTDADKRVYGCSNLPPITAA